MNEARAHQFVGKLSEIAGDVLEGGFCEDLLKYKRRIEGMLYKNDGHFRTHRVNQIFPALNIMNRRNKSGGELPYYVLDFVDEVRKFSINPLYILRGS